MNLFTQIHEIVFHGKGGYDWNTIYEMPKWLRQFVFNQINDFYQKEAEAIEESRGKKGNSTHSTLIDSQGNVNREAWKQVQVPQQVSKAASNKSKVNYK